MTKAILLVEDSPQDEKLILRALRKVDLDREVEVARDGRQALDYLFREGEFTGRTGSNQPHLIILDINMPRIGGINVLKRVRNDPRTRLIPVVVFSSSDEERDRLSCYENGASSFVQKPLDFDEFAENVTHMGLYWLNANCPPSG